MEKTEIEKMIRGHLQIGTSHPDNKNVLELSEALVKSLQSAYQAKDTLRDAFYAGQLYQRSIDKNTKQHAPNFEAYYNSLSSPPAEKELKDITDEEKEHIMSIILENTYEDVSPEDVINCLIDTHSCDLAGYTWVEIINYLTNRGYKI